MKPSNLLAHWEYSNTDWNSYVTVEKKNKREDNFYFGCAISTLCTLGLMLFRNTTFLIALAFAIPFSILLPWLRMKFSYKYLQKGIKHPEVKIFDKFLKINKHTIIFKNDQRRLKNIQLVEAPNGFQLLEFDVQWITRKGPTNDEYRILIPSDKMDEAMKIIKKLT